MNSTHNLANSVNISANWDCMMEYRKASENTKCQFDLANRLEMKGSRLVMKGSRLVMKVMVRVRLVHKQGRLVYKLEMLEYKLERSERKQETWMNTRVFLKYKQSSHYTPAYLGNATEIPVNSQETWENILEKQILRGR